MAILRDYNLKSATWLKQIIDIINDQGTLWHCIRVRCVSVFRPDKGLWVNALAHICVWPEGKQPPARSACRYQNIRLLEEWLPIGALPQVLEQVATNKKLVVCGDEIVLDSSSGFSQREFFPRTNWISPYPGWCYLAHRSDTPQLPHEPLLAPGLPYFGDGCHALQEWFEIRGISQNDSRIGGAFLFLPELRAGIESIEIYEAEKLVFKPIYRSDPVRKGVELKGGWAIDKARPTFTHPFESEVALDVPVGASGFAVYMVGADGTMFDYHDEIGSWVEGGPRVLGGLQLGNVSAVVQKALKSGECDIVEYKPFIHQGDQKQDEIVESTIAFANTKGGTILFGIDKHSAVEGVEQDIHRLSKTSAESPDASVEKYKGWLKRLIGDSLNRGLALDFHYVSLEGHKVLVMLVPEGQEKPYARVRSNDIWVRKGSNNVRPDPDTDLQDLLPRRDPNTAMFGQGPLGWIPRLGR